MFLRQNDLDVSYERSDCLATNRTGFTPDEPRFSLRSIRFRAKHVRALSSTSRALGAIAENDLYSCYILRVRIQEHFAVVDFLSLMITVRSNVLLNLNRNKERTCIAQKSPVYFRWIVWRVVKPVWIFTTWLDISNEEDLKIIVYEANIFFLILSNWILYLSYDSIAYDPTYFCSSFDPNKYR